MTALAWLIPAALALGVLGLGAFIWALNTGQFEDLDGAAWRALDDVEPDANSRKSGEVAGLKDRGGAPPPRDQRQHDA